MAVGPLSLIVQIGHFNFDLLPNAWAWNGFEDRIIEEEHLIRICRVIESSVYGLIRYANWAIVKQRYVSTETQLSAVVHNLSEDRPILCELIVRPCIDLGTAVPGLPRLSGFYGDGESHVGGDNRSGQEYLEFPIKSVPVDN